MVLKVLWLGVMALLGMALLSACALMLYTLGTLLVSVSAGAQKANPSRKLNFLETPFY